MIPLDLVGVRVELPANQPIVLLRDPSTGRYLPIWIGGAEAMSISTHLEGERPPRPLTHQLLADTLAALGAVLEAVHLTDLREGTFYAELHLLQGDREVIVSARPSDAIALAIRVGDVPLLVDEALFERVAIELGDVDEGEEDVDPEEEVRRFRAFLEDLDPEDFEQFGEAGGPVEDPTADPADDPSDDPSDDGR
jgi:bifunctional DNase/RNase